MSRHSLTLFVKFMFLRQFFSHSIIVIYLNCNFSNNNKLNIIIIIKQLKSESTVKDSCVGKKKIKSNNISNYVYTYNVKCNIPIMIYMFF